jgi:hypothetical protein
MSPSESDLRAALHDGEGGSLNVDLLIMKAEVRAAQRRTRLLSAAIVVGVVASAGVGLGFLSTHSKQDEKNGALSAGGQAASVPAQAHARAGGANVGASAAGTGSGTSAYSSAYGCPAEVSATHPEDALATSTRTSMFSAQVSTVVLCSYNALTAAKDNTRRPATTPDQVVLHGAQAKQLVQSLKQAPQTRPTDPCPMVRTVSRPLVIFAYTPSGKVAGVASTDLGVPVCNIVSFSDRDVRYNWTAPFSLAPAMGNLAPVAAPTAAQPTH